MNDVEQRLVDLADVVKEGSAGDTALLLLGQFGGVGEHEGVFRDAADVHAGVGVVGIDGAQE